MKKFKFRMGSWEIDNIFSPIRSKQQCIAMLMKTLKIMIADVEINDEDAAAEVILIVSKMSRLFYVSQNKYFSINFPFQVKELNGKLCFSSKNIMDIDSRVTSQVLSVVANPEVFDSDCPYTFFGFC